MNVIGRKYNGTRAIRFLSYNPNILSIHAYILRANTHSKSNDRILWIKSFAQIKILDISGMTHPVHVELNARLTFYLYPQE